MSRQIWMKDDRQVMNTNTYEIFHNYTEHSIELEFHTHNFYEVLIFLDGKVDYQVEDKTYPLRPGDILLTNSSEMHRAIIKDGKPYDRFVGWFHPDFVNRINSQLVDVNVASCFDSSSKMHFNLLHADIGTFHQLVKLFEQLMTPADENIFGDQALRDCFATEILILLNQAHLNTTITPGVHIISNPKVNDVIFYINQNLCEELSLDSLSEHFYISKYYLTRLFKQYTGLSLHQYILRKRLNTAKTMLANGCLPYDACMDSGFKNYSHFSKCFKDLFLISPSEYEKLH